ncbi:ABC transporter ATP-binding protein [Weissella confusa]|uniref:ABC transporter ATP-binding protein n=1 Tax=Weissella confusa TaxID=1583 RepID=A0A4Z0RKE9_WEICO|nr:ABC transporter ATP-binding protein [Weissella confusa]MBJ7632030.1 ABC transporter ATP-binding protein [Weissella confusa]MBJ7639427.1 ABC transporter ATP-binding protein [Weissella confusa]MBJ7644578.1 ABC transporter ATP-binding protein [Weissella confusa]MBJ7668674.1 ABC transporter ATP-binding protein [Weissella confusa]MBJ7673993.1 ABC transporter ATP-binding protein [Weissella confusa]
MDKTESVWTKKMGPREQWRIVRALFGFMQPFAKYFYSALLLAGIISVLNVVMPRVLQDFMNNHLHSTSPQWRILVMFALIYLALTLVKAVIQFFQDYWFMSAAEFMVEAVRMKLYRKLHTLGMRYFDQTPAGSLVSRVTNDTATFESFWQLFLTLTIGLFSIVSAFIAMWLTNVQVTLVTLIFVPLLIGSIWLYQVFATSAYRSMREKISALNAQLAEAITGISVIQQFRQEDRIATEFDTTNESYYRSRVRMVKTNSLLLSPMVDLLYGAAIIAVLLMFGWTSERQIVAAGSVYAFLSYVGSFYNPIDAAMDSLSAFQDGIVAGNRILAILADETVEPKQLVNASNVVQDGKVEFKHVSFSYDGQHDVLKNISFVAEPGQTVALVGHTGSGKSSTINAMMRFYEFQSGDILIDDQDIRSLDLAIFRREVGLVLQDPYLFYGDVMSNIRMFDETITDAQIEAAATFVHANEFIDKLPNRYHEAVAERGAGFSSGQRQLISFARTIVRNPKILVLDEATADVDTETETIIQSSLAAMRQSRTTIVIAHRLSTIKDADLILVLDKGEIVERGTHNDLLILGGQYADLYKMQTGTI